MSRDFYRNRSKLGSIPQISTSVPVYERVYTYNMSAQPSTSEMAFSNNGSSFNGQWYCNPTDHWGDLKTNFNLGITTSVKVKAKITNCADTWWNYESVRFLDSSGNEIASVASSSGANGSNDGGYFKATNGAGYVQQAISNNWGTYYIELSATSSEITFKIYNSSNTLLYTLAGSYTTGKSFANIAKVGAYIYSSSSGGAYLDDLVITIV